MGQDALAAAIAASEEEIKPSAEELEHAAAVARGDVIELPKEVALDPLIVAPLAGVVDDNTALPAVDNKKDDGGIPRPRFNEVIEENRRLKEQLEALAKPVDAAVVAEQEQQAAVNPRETLKELRRQQDALKLEGDIDEAAQIGDKIDELILDIATSQARTSMKQENQSVNLHNSLNDVAARAFEMFPFLDTDSEACDTDAVISVRSRRDELIAGGIHPAKALQTAVDEKGPKFAKLLDIATPADNTNRADVVRAARDQAARERAANASILQPAGLPNKGEKESFAVNVDTLTPAQINAMPEEQKAKLRGDTV